MFIVWNSLHYEIQVIVGLQQMWQPATTFHRDFVEVQWEEGGLQIWNTKEIFV